jgi:hypothetical protein
MLCFSWTDRKIHTKGLITMIKVAQYTSLFSLFGANYKKKLEKWVSTEFNEDQTFDIIC